MTNSIITFVPRRDLLGRFKASKKTKAKILFVILAFTSFYTNYHLLKANYVITCSEGGHFMSKAKCDELFTNRMDSIELARQQILEANQDLFTN